MSYHLRIVLYRPQAPENVGLILRTAKSLGAKEVIAFVNPEWLRNPKIHKRIKQVSTGVGNDLLTLRPQEEFEKFLETHKDHLIAIEKTEGIESLPITDIHHHLTHLSEINLLFGNEGRGIPKKYLKDLKVFHIPYDYPNSLNLSHSVAITLWELYRSNLP